MTLFFIGIIEMLIVTVWTKTVTNTMVLASGAVTLVNVLVWYYVLQKMISDIGNFKLAFFYALGCSLGTVITTFFFQWKESKTN